MAYDYQPGRPLSVMIQTLRRTQLPMGLEHVLTVLRDLSSVLSHIHESGFEHGVLNAHQVWVSYEGAVTLLDATFASAVKTSLNHMSAPPTGLEWTVNAPKGGFRRDLFLLACLGWQMMTLESEVPADSQALLQTLDASALQKGQALPEDLRHLFSRMVGLEKPFNSLAEFQDLATESLHKEEDQFSTFNLAFLLHSAFRESIPAEERAMNHEREMLYMVAADATMPPQAIGATKGSSSALRWVGFTAAAVGLGAVGLLAQRSWSQETQALRGSLAQSQARAAQLNQQVQTDRLKASQILPTSPEPPVPLAPSEGSRAAFVSDGSHPYLAEPVETSKAPAVMRLQFNPAAPSSAATAGSANRTAALLRLPSTLPFTGYQGSRPIRMNLRVFVGETGKAMKVMVLDGSPTDPALEEAVVKAVLQGAYLAALREGRPSRDWVEVSLTLN